MRAAYEVWKPASKGFQEHLANEVMTTLAVYGYGALPSDPVHMKAKVAGFCSVLESLPLWAIKAAGEEWRATQSDAPTPVDLARSAKMLMGYYVPVPGVPPLKLEHGVEIPLRAGVAYDKLVAWLKV